MSILEPFALRSSLESMTLPDHSANDECKNCFFFLGFFLWDRVCANSFWLEFVYSPFGDGEKCKKYYFCWEKIHLVGFTGMF